MRTLIVLALATTLLAPLTYASPPAIVEAPTSVGLEGAVDAVTYSHYDCVGTGAPGTAPPHATHTTRVGGFVFNGAGINFGMNALNLFGVGPCPVTAANAGVLPTDFTGTLRLTAVCRGTLNDGAPAASWTVSFLAGTPRSNSFVPGTCRGYVNTAFALDVTIATGPVDVLPGVPVGPLGGIVHTISQT